MGNGRITDEISPLVEITGHRSTEGAFPVHAAPGLVAIRPGPASRWVRLTDPERRYGIRLLAGKSAEADFRARTRRGGSAAAEDPPEAVIGEKRRLSAQRLVQGRPPAREQQRWRPCCRAQPNLEGNQS